MTFLKSEDTVLLCATKKKKKKKLNCFLPQTLIYLIIQNENKKIVNVMKNLKIRLAASFIGNTLYFNK